MKTTRLGVLLRNLSIAMLLSATASCVQLPTEKQGVVDLRPQISFKVDGANALLTSSRILIDGIDVGAASEFLDGVNSLKILPGTHQIKVVTDGRTILEERFYVGDAVRKSFTLK